MSNLDLQNLLNHREDIFKAEIGALLFNLGKTHVGFWKEKKEKNILTNMEEKQFYFSLNDNDFFRDYQYKNFTTYKDYYQQAKNLSNDNITTITPNTFPYTIDLNKVSPNLLNFITGIQYNLPNGDIHNLFELQKGGIAPKNSFEHKVFFNGCENINSGIDKSFPQKLIKSPLSIVNAFGSDNEIIDIKNFDIYRISFYHKLDNYLRNKNLYSNSSLNKNDWLGIKKFVYKEIQEWYINLLSDSRMPVNDVTLWEQAFMTAAMFKATLAGLYLDNSNYDSCIKNPNTIKWRILGIQYDKLALAEKGLKPANIQWYRDKSNDVEDKYIKPYLELRLCLGNEVYRDETGIYFIVSENVGDSRNKLSTNLQTIEKTIYRFFQNAFNGEVYPSINLTSPSRVIMTLKELLNESKKNFLKSNNSYMKLPQLKSGIGICKVCEFRIVDADIMEEDKQTCKICNDRKIGRVSNWIKKINGESIWIDDLQDKNGNIALITLKMELGEWLNGNMLSSSIINIENYQSTLNEIINELKNSRITRNNSSVFMRIAKEAYISTSNFNDFIRQVFFEELPDSSWDTLVRNHSINSKINWATLEFDWNKLTDPDVQFLSEILLQFLLRKNPSPARLRRIWETTRMFFDDIKKDIKKNSGIKDWRCKRLVWNISNDVAEGEHTLGDISFWIKDNKVYLITSIEKAIPLLVSIRGEKLDEAKKRDDNWLKDNLKNEPIVLVNKDNPDISFNLSISENVTFIDYLPIFSIIDPTPISWQFIIPADRVTDLIKNVQDEYKKNFKWVYGKLPLHIGVVFQDRKRPLYVGIKALCNIRRDIKDWDEIKIESNAKGIFDLQNNPTSDQGDILERANKTKDYYSLYELTNNDTNDKGKYQFILNPKLAIQNPQSKIENLKSKLDYIDSTRIFKIYPNTIDFQYLDTNSRRDEIYYETGKRVSKYKSNRPYTWEEWKHFSEFIEKFNKKEDSAQIQTLASLIYSKLEEWKDKENEKSISQFIYSAICNTFKKEKRGILFKILEIKSQDSITAKQLYTFLDMFEFYHTALKEI
jgi:CRISPR-associated Csx11 family protein